MPCFVKAVFKSADLRLEKLSKCHIKRKEEKSLLRWLSSRHPIPLACKGCEDCQATKGQASPLLRA